MSLALITVVGGLFLFFAAIQGRLHGSVLTAPLLFSVFGVAIYFSGLAHGHFELEWLHIVAEITLVLVLFADAARIDLNAMRNYHNLSLRMLLLGMPLIMIAGTVVAYLVFPGLSWWELALIAAILAPTDAALGQAVILDKGIPGRIRQTLNVESGLNDGMALPAVLLFATLASDVTHTDRSWVEFIALQLVLGPIVGGLVGWIGAKTITWAVEKGGLVESGEGIAVLALALLSYAGAETVGGNGFISAFVAGAVFRHNLKTDCAFLFGFMETEGEFFMLATFFGVGLILIPQYLPFIDGMVILYAVLSLTVVRMIPISISLLGTGLLPPTHLFLGWFGPRGLASVVFSLLVLDEFEIASMDLIMAVVVTAVSLSIVAHGLSAVPFARAYGKMVAAMPDCEEKNAVPSVSLRSGPVTDAEVTN